PHLTARSTRSFPTRRSSDLDVQDSGHTRREVYFGSGPELKGRDVLVVDAVLESGVTQEFLLRRLGESKPRSIRLAVLLDKPAKRSEEHTSELQSLRHLVCRL